MSLQYTKTRNTVPHTRGNTKPQPTQNNRLLRQYGPQSQHIYQDTRQQNSTHGSLHGNHILYLWILDLPTNTWLANGSTTNFKTMHDVIRELSTTGTKKLMTRPLPFNPPTTQNVVFIMNENHTFNQLFTTCILSGSTCLKSEMDDVGIEKVC